MRKNKVKSVLLVLILVILVFIIIFFVGRSFGFFKYVKEGTLANIITINGIEVKILNEEVSNSALNLEGAYPVYDSEGLTNDPFMFSMTNTASRSLSYSIRIVVDEEKMKNCILEDGTSCPQLDTKYIKYAYKKNDGTYSEPMKLSDSGNIIASGVIEGKETVTSSVIIWIDSEADNEIMNNYFYGKIIITGEQFVPKNLKEAILAENTLIEDEPDLTTSSNNTSDATGLYVSTLTNDGSPTYYFRGYVKNNYVSFAGFTWRIVRINEDGTVRLIMQDVVNNETFPFNSIVSDIKYMYYSESDVAKTTLERWYQDNIISNGYSDMVATGNYFCEQAKVSYSEEDSINSGVTMKIYDIYEPNFKCSNDANGYGIVNSNIGLITYDEVIHAGGYFGEKNNFYLNIGKYYWMMSPTGFSNSWPRVWRVSNTGYISHTGVTVSDAVYLRPVINLKADTYVSGNGTSTSPYTVITDKKYIPRNLNNAVMADNILVEAEPNLKTTSELAGENGLYMSRATNSGDPTYYFRGNVKNNYVEFAGFIWRIVRVNEDGTVRLIMSKGINDNAIYQFNSKANDEFFMYYSESDTARPTLQMWYQDNIIDNGYADIVSVGDYFCEEAKVRASTSHTSESTTMSVYSDYEPTFKCKPDGNGKGVLNDGIGLITYDEVLYAGGYYAKENKNYYLYSGIINWTMSPAGVNSNDSAIVWNLYSAGSANLNLVDTSVLLRPVINLKTDTIITGLGTSDLPYKVQ